MYIVHKTTLKALCEGIHLTSIGLTVPKLTWRQRKYTQSASGTQKNSTTKQAIQVRNEQRTCTDSPQKEKCK